MKKLTALLILFLTLLFSINVKASTKILPDNPSDLDSAKPLELYQELNIFKGMNDVDEILNSMLFNILLEKEESINKGVIECSLNLYNDNGIYSDLYCNFYYENNKFYYTEVYYNDLLVYDFNRDENNNITINTNVVIDLYDLYNSYECFYVAEPPRIYDNFELGDPFTQEDYLLFEEYAFRFIYGMKYVYNTAYDGKELHFIVEHENPLTLEELLSDIEIKDTTDKLITEYEIYNNTYILVDGKINIGQYSFTILARDSYGNTVIQDCIVDVLDGRDPIIEINNNIDVSYTKKLTENEILGMCTIKDTSQIKETTVNIDEYSNNFNSLGVYNCQITSIDIYDNTTTKNFTITVIDDIPPVIVKKNITVVYPYNELSVEDIKSFITANDKIEGLLSEENITLNSDDLDNYKSNHTKLGLYQIEAIVSDSKGNTTSVVLNISVADEDYPQIYIDTYTIVLQEGDILTQEQIKNLLIQSGQINEADDIVLSSLYFVEDNPQGKYDLEITLPDGRIITNTISISEDNNITYQPPIKRDKNNNLPLIIGSSIAGFMVLAIVISGIIIYKKRH